MVDATHEPMTQPKQPKVVLITGVIDPAGAYWTPIKGPSKGWPCRQRLWPLWRTGMKNDAEIRQEGMRALIRGLGSVEAERFVPSISKDRFNYTEWRRTDLPETDVVELSRHAAAFSKQHQN